MAETTSNYIVQPVFAFGPQVVVVCFGAVSDIIKLFPGRWHRWNVYYSGSPSQDLYDKQARLRPWLRSVTPLLSHVLVSLSPGTNQPFLSPDYSYARAAGLLRRFVRSEGRSYERSAAGPARPGPSETVEVFRLRCLSLGSCVRVVILAPGAPRHFCRRFPVSENRIDGLRRGMSRAMVGTVLGGGGERRQQAATVPFTHCSRAHAPTPRC